MSDETRETWITRRVEMLTEQTLTAPPRIFKDTTTFMYIDRGDIIDLEGRLFLIRGHEKEGRFGIDEQPKFWVKRALNLEDGRRYILKLSCQESFWIHIGNMEVYCARSAEKEARVLELVRGDRRFMQGGSARDSQNNLIRVIDFIDGTDLIHYLAGVDMPHERYFHELFPMILAKIVSAFRAIQLLNDNGLCHGDIRNDHILVERATGNFRWIDFDLNQNSSTYDLWCLGNVLHFVVAKGFITFRELIQARPQLADRFGVEDASVFFPNRVMNFSKVYGYVPDRLNEILTRFSIGATACYDTIAQVVDDLADCANSMGCPLDEVANPQ